MTKEKKWNTLKEIGSLKSQRQNAVFSRLGWAVLGKRNLKKKKKDIKVNERNNYLIILVIGFPERRNSHHKYPAQQTTCYIAQGGKHGMGND